MNNDNDRIFAIRDEYLPLAQWLQLLLAALIYTSATKKSIIYWKHCSSSFELIDVMVK